MPSVKPAWLSGYAGTILLVVVLVNLAAQLFQFSYGLTLPSMRDNLGLSYSQAGSLVTAGSMVGMVGAVAFGAVASRYGSRLIVGLTAIVAGVAMAFLGSAPNFLFALLMSAVVGFNTQGCTTVSMGLLSAWFHSRNRGAAAGVAAAGGGASFIIVGGLVPWLTGRDPVDGWRHTWYVIAVISVAVGFISLMFIRDNPKGGAGAPKRQLAWPMEVYRNRFVWLIAILAFFSQFGAGTYTTFFGLYLEQEGISLGLSGRLWQLLGLLGIVSGVFWGYVSDRLGRRAGFWSSFVALGVGCLLFWIAPVLTGFVASVVLVGLTFRASYVICAAAAGDYVSPRVSAAAFGLMGMGAALGSATGPQVGGRIADATGDLGLVFAMAGAAVGAATLTSFLLRAPVAAPAA